MKGTIMPRILPVGLTSVLSEAPTVEQSSKKGEKKKKKKSKKKKIPKGFEESGEADDLFINKSNSWYFQSTTKLYFKNKNGPFFVFDSKQKKLVPAKV